MSADRRFGEGVRSRGAYVLAELRRRLGARKKLGHDGLTDTPDQWADLGHWEHPDRTTCPNMEDTHICSEHGKWTRWATPDNPDPWATARNAVTDLLAEVERLRVAGAKVQRLGLYAKTLDAVVARAEQAERERDNWAKAAHEWAPKLDAAERLARELPEKIAQAIEAEPIGFGHPMGHECFRCDATAAAARIARRHCRKGRRYTGLTDLPDPGEERA